MHEDSIRHHIESSVGRSGRGAGSAGRDECRTRELIARIARECWPAGAEDRIEHGALDWLRRWRPATRAAALPSCSCPHGRCAICN
jgi:hypothetical protein